MNSIAWTTVGAFGCGLLVYAALAQWLPEVDMGLLGGIVGLSALAGAALGKAIAARLGRSRTTDGT